MVQHLTITYAAAVGLSIADKYYSWCLRSAEAAGICGKPVTPYLLDFLANESGGRTLQANIALLENNARIAARVAMAVTKLNAA